MTVQTTFQPQRVNVAAPTLNWSYPPTRIETACQDSPAVALLGDTPYVVWRSGDSLSWTRRTPAGTWNRPQEILDGEIPKPSSAPALVAFHSGLLLVWVSDNQLYSSVFAYGWSRPQKVPSAEAPFRTSHVPALVSFRSNVLMVWKDDTTSNQFCSSLFNGAAWSEVQPVTAPNAEAAQALTFLQEEDKVLLVWKVPDRSLNGLPYLTQNFSWMQVEEGQTTTLMGAGASSTGPALGLYRKRPLLVWVGGEASNVQIYYSVYDGTKWPPRELVPGAKSATQPALAYGADKIYLAWKGLDQLIYLSSADSRGSTADFGTDTHPIAFGVYHDETVSETFIKKESRLYANGTVSLTNTERDVVLRISNSRAADHSIDELLASYHHDTDLPRPLYATQDSTGQWIVTLPKELIGAGGAIHVEVSWTDTSTGEPKHSKEDPVIIVNIGN